MIGAGGAGERAIDPRTPVIVGVGQCGRPGDHEPGAPHDPAWYLVEAARRAAADSGAGDRLLRRADSVRAVSIVSWRYPNVAALAAERLGIAPRETVQTADFGGDGPQRLLNETARDVAEGRLEVALLGGGEAIASRRPFDREGKPLPWPDPDHAPPPDRIVGGDLGPPSSPQELTAGLSSPPVVYALVESALRAAQGLGIEEHRARIATLWSRFSQVGAVNPLAAVPEARTAEEIARVTPENRIVSTPYSKLMNANNDVDLGAAVLLCSAGAARAAGVPPDRWVFPHAGAQATDGWVLTERTSLCASPAIAATGRALVGEGGVTDAGVEHLDIYSCFPSAVQIASRELGADPHDPGRELTVTGGLTFLGGPGNNYAMHSIATMVERLRSDPGTRGLVTAVGWYMTKHALGLYGTSPPPGGFRLHEPEVAEGPPVHVCGEHEGEVRIEAATVLHDRSSSPVSGSVCAWTPNGERTLGTITEPDLLTELAAEEPAGRRGHRSRTGTVDLL